MTLGYLASMLGTIMSIMMLVALIVLFIWYLLQALGVIK